jgi:hypothetical protein
MPDDVMPLTKVERLWMLALYSDRNGISGTLLPHGRSGLAGGDH